MRAAILALLLLLAACGERATPMFARGDYVVTRLSGYKGMVIYVRCSRLCLYNVRFAALEIQTNTRLLGSDGPITLAPLTTMYSMREYELRRAEKGEHIDR